MPIMTHPRLFYCCPNNCNDYLGLVFVKIIFYACCSGVGSALGSGPY